MFYKNLHINCCSIYALDPIYNLITFIHKKANYPSSYSFVMGIRISWFKNQSLVEPYFFSFFFFSG